MTGTTKGRKNLSAKLPKKLIQEKQAEKFAHQEPRVGKHSASMCKFKRLLMCQERVPLSDRDSKRKVSSERENASTSLRRKRVTPRPNLLILESGFRRGFRSQT